MKVVIDAQRELLLEVQGSNIWSGQQVQVSLLPIRLHSTLHMLTNYIII